MSGRRIRKKFRFKNKLVSLDASVIDLSLSLFDWAQFRTKKVPVPNFAVQVQVQVGNAA